MANPTTNYGFVLPTSTDLVTDLPADFDVALQGVDTRLKALQPGTTAGDLVYASSTANTNLRLGIGTTGQNLTVVSGVPAWTTLATGALTLLSTTSLTGASTTVSSISGSFKNLLIFIKDFNSSTNTECLLGINSDNTAANYVQTIIRATGTTSSPFSDNTTPGAFIAGHTILSSQTDAFAAFTIPNYANTTTKKALNGFAVYTTNASLAGVSNTTCAYHGTVAAVTALNFKVAAGTWSAGTVEIYGEN